MKKLILLLSILALSSCHKIHSGEVKDKFIVPAHEYTYTTFINAGNNVLVPIVNTGYAGPEFILVVTGKKDTVMITEEFSVDYGTFLCKGIGSYFIDTLNCEEYEPK